MSGHSKWATIKRKKGAADAKRGQAFTKLIKEVTVAARMGGGDPAGNPRLRRAIDDCRAQNMPADNITRAIKKGTGELEGVVYEELTYEGVGVDGVLIIVETVTDNKNRTAPELKKIFEKHGGSLGGSGTAQWAFDHKGVVRINKSAISEENLLEIVGESGAEDIAADDDQWVITCPPVAFGSVRDAVDAAKLKVIEGKLEHLPKTPKKVTGENAETLMNMLDLLDEHDDVQQLFSEAEFE